MRAEIDRVAAKAQVLQGQLNRARARIATFEIADRRIRSIHHPDVYHEYCNDPDCRRVHNVENGDLVHPDVVTVRYCHHCSVATLVDYPCATINALDGHLPAPARP